MWDWLSAGDALDGSLTSATVRAVTAVQVLAELVVDEIRLRERIREDGTEVRS